jgi:RNA polymerase sigma factor (sigma-70 family)
MAPLVAQAGCVGLIVQLSFTGGLPGLVRSRLASRAARETRVSEVPQLVRAAEQGDQAAWRAIVDRYNRLVWSVARAHRLSQQDAADVVQTTWLRLVEHLGDVEDPQHLGGWLATTARRESLCALRRSARQVPSAPETFPDPGYDARIGGGLLDAERDALLWQAFGQLSERCRTLLSLLIADPPLSYQEIGAALDLPIGSIGPTRGRCLETLRQHAAAVGLMDERHAPERGAT